MSEINYLPIPSESFHDMLLTLYPEQGLLNKKVRQVTFQVTEDCCMACTYCYQHKKTNNKMTFEVAQKFIDDLLADKYDCINTSNTFGINFDFIGGEPFLEIELIEQICDYIFQRMIELRHPWLYYCRMSMSSNGILYSTPKVQKFFQKYGRLTSLGISIDGNKILHDACRIDLNGQGTYDRAIQAAHDYKKMFGSLPSTKMTIAPENVNFLFDAILNLINEGYTTIMLNCVYENVWNNQHALILYNQLKNISDYLIKNDLYNKIYIRMFEEDNFQPMEESHNENWCGGVSDTNLSVNYTGNLYPCVRYMESSLNYRQKPIIVGNVNEGYLSTEEHKINHQQVSNITRRSQSTDKCFYCPIAAGCSWCSAYNYEEFGTANKRATYICCMHQAMSLANVYHWNNLYKYLNIDKNFVMHIPKEWALEIIDIDEYQYLLNLSKGDLPNE